MVLNEPSSREHFPARVPGQTPGKGRIGLLDEWARLLGFPRVWIFGIFIFLGFEFLILQRLRFVCVLSNPLPVPL